MTFAAPWALAGLLFLPVLWWLHVRLKTRPPLVLPSLIFLQDAQEAAPPPRRIFDAELLLTLAGATLLVLGALGPRVELRPAGRTLDVVVSGGAPMGARGQETRVEAWLDDLRGHAQPGDRLRVRRVPPTGERHAPRPAPGVLLSASLAEQAARRFVLSDQAAPPETNGVRWIELGSPNARNAGIVSVAVRPEGEGLEVFVAVHAQGVEALGLLARDEAGAVLAPTRALALDRRGLATAELLLARAPDVVTLDLVSPDGSRLDDLLEADDRVVLVRRPLAVSLGPALGAQHAALVRRTLAVLLGVEGTREVAEGADLAVVAGPHEGTPPAWRLELFPVAEDVPGTTAPLGVDARVPDPLAADLSTVGADLVYAPHVLGERPGALVLLRRGGFAVVEREGRVVRFLPDPLAGRRAPASHPLWPLFLENLVREVAGVRSTRTSGYRIQGLLDLASSRLGDRAEAFDRRVLEGAGNDRAAEVRSLRPWLLASGLLCLLLLWARPLFESLPRARRRGARAPVPSRP